MKNTTEKGTKENGKEEDEEDAMEDEKYNEKAWDTLSKSFRQVQSMLYQNPALIQQVNDNHRSTISDNIVENVALIRQINGNISKVLSLYSDLSVNFSNLVHQRRRETVVNKNDEKDSSLDQVEITGSSMTHAQDESQMIDGCGIAFLHYSRPQIF
ncbi:protein EARLY FLOWERING 4-like [Quillaja saponaria]|uniref:Protein EARLY FLOWERING 4-like n=1 Tax=Quillaja saponaria TaxID=32244 RepID=A0AAD7LVG6_QUISA|nr:protein EARLY FLOWERING 4-like [Quillaja saponaria]